MSANNASQLNASISPIGIAGWLIVSIGVLILTVLFGAYEFLKFISPENIETLKLMMAENTSELDKFIYTYFAYGGLLFVTIVTACYCLFLIYKKSRHVKYFIFLHYIAAFCASVAAFLNAWEVYLFDTKVEMSSDFSYTIVRAFTLMVIWVPYYYFSKRVRNTFVS
jgi:Protein of unknown function (DUF2569)